MLPGWSTSFRPYVSVARAEASIDFGAVASVTCRNSGADSPHEALAPRGMVCCLDHRGERNTSWPGSRDIPVACAPRRGEEGSALTCPAASAATADRPAHHHRHPGGCRTHLVAADPARKTRIRCNSVGLVHYLPSECASWKFHSSR